MVAKGFTQQEGIDYTETFSPVARHTTFRLLLALGTTEQFHYAHADVKTAFLYADLKEKQYLRLPKYFVKYMQDKHGKYMHINVNTADKDYALQLNKALYGLKQAPREWNDTIDRFIKHIGFTRSRSDVCLYYRGGKEDKELILLYVDDIIIATKSKEQTERIKQTIRGQFCWIVNDDSHDDSE